MPKAILLKRLATYAAILITLVLGLCGGSHKLANRPQRCYFASMYTPPTLCRWSITHRCPDLQGSQSKFHVHHARREIVLLAAGNSWQWPLVIISD